MLKSHNKFLEGVRNYDFDGMMISRKIHEQWAATLPCPVLYIDGTEAISENVEQIVEKYKASEN